MSRLLRASSGVVIGSVMILSGCGADPSDIADEDGQSRRTSNKITGSVSEWDVDASADIAEAGEVTFAITNFGTVPHEFLVTKTTFEPGAIPLGDNNRFDEELDGISVIDEIPEFEVETTGLLKVTLEPGVYELLCNIEGHYAAGMHRTLEVVPSTKPAAPPPMALVDKVSNDIDGSVKEWEVKVGATKANSGEVSFNITNEGTIQHEFLVVKTEFELGKIPLGDNNRFDEELDGIEVVDEIPEWEVGKIGQLTVDLEPGLYQLLCNIEGHYKNGMYAGFEVLNEPKPAAPVESISNDIDGSVKEWEVKVGHTKANAGEVTFMIANDGTVQHEFLVVKTDYAPGKIPLGDNNRFDEELDGIEVVDEIPEWKPGTTGELTVDLEPGLYQLLCNIEGHYKNGMYVGFEVV